MIDETPFENLPEDPVLAALDICNIFKAYDDKIKVTDKSIYYNNYLAYFAVFQAHIDSFKLDFHYPELGDDKKENIKRIRRFFLECLQQLKLTKVEHDTRRVLDSYKSRYLMQFGKIFSYEFTEGDLARLKRLINELAAAALQSQELSQEHQSRFMKRLEQLRFSLSKRTPDLSPFWGLIGEIGVFRAKCPQDAETITAAIAKILAVVWQTQARAEELAHDAPPPITSFSLEATDDELQDGADLSLPEPDEPDLNST